MCKKNASPGVKISLSLCVTLYKHAPSESACHAMRLNRGCCVVDEKCAAFKHMLIA